MSSDVANEFANMVIENRYILLKINKETQCISVIPDNALNDEWRCFLYKKDYGAFLTINDQEGNICDIDYVNSPVIQYIRTQIKYEKKIITRGRLWVTGESLKDGFANKQMLIKDYNTLVNWIKKRVPYQNVSLTNFFGNECVAKKYINDEIVRLVYQGFDLQ